MERFWTLLDRLPDGEASAYEWKVEVGDLLWPVVQSFLRTTGARAQRVPCPSPAGDNCPRVVGPVKNGKCRVICSETPPECETEILNLDEIINYKVDLAKLGNAISKSLELKSARAPASSQKVHYCGNFAMSGGADIPVVLFVMDLNSKDRIEALEMLDDLVKPSLLLISTKFSLSKHEKQFVEKRGTVVRSCLELFDVGNDNKMIATDQGYRTLPSLSKKITSKQPKASSMPNIPFAVDAKWGDVAIDFPNKNEMHLRYRGKTYRLDPEALRMKKQNSPNTKLQWLLLKLFGALKGRIKLPGPAQTNVYGISGLDLNRLKKQKQILAEQLKAAFPIQDEPIEWNDGCYVTTFTISYSGLKQGVQGQGEISPADLKNI